MRALAISSGCLLLAFSAHSLAQVDIYQSDAYSVEEMCAREAEQSDTADYSGAYDSCIKKNRENPMYHTTPEGNNTSDASDDKTRDHDESEP